jgi:hypothetical protein
MGWPPMVSRRRCSNRRDEMARKRSKRASKTVGAGDYIERDSSSSLPPERAAG